MQLITTARVAVATAPNTWPGRSRLLATITSAWTQTGMGRDANESNQLVAARGVALCRSGRLRKQLRPGRLVSAQHHDLESDLSWHLALHSRCGHAALRATA